MPNNQESAMATTSIALASRAHHGTISSVNMNAIRGAAALVVLLGHTRSLFFSSLSAADHPLATAQSLGQNAGSAPGPITMGNEAVIIFFVLSGYLVGGSAIRDLRNGTWSWKKYLTMRLTRLWVVLLPALLFGVAIDHSGLRMFSGTQSIYSGPPGLCIVPCNLVNRISPKVVVANALFLQERFADTAGSNNALWSLTNEFWYYLAFPMCLLALQTNQPMLRRAFYAVLLLAITALLGKDIFLLFFVWLLGALIYTMPLKFPRNMLKSSTYGVAILLLGVTMGVRRASLPRYLAECMIAVCFSVLLYLVLHRTEQARASIYKSVADFFSRVSYTLYLVHLPLAVFLCACINTPWHHWDKTPSHLALFLLMNVSVVAFSYTFYLAFEANTDRVRRALFHRGAPEPGPRQLAQAQSENLIAQAVSEVDVAVGWQSR
jgi:peptidoglycan/LPS O-acetylase OafA/YrhL